MENGEEWRAEDISSPIRFCVWLTKTKKEYVCTTILGDWCQQKAVPGPVQLRGQGANAELLKG